VTKARRKNDGTDVDEEGLGYTEPKRVGVKMLPVGGRSENQKRRVWPAPLFTAAPRFFQLPMAYPDGEATKAWDVKSPKYLVVDDAKLLLRIKQMRGKANEKLGCLYSKNI